MIEINNLQKNFGQKKAVDIEKYVIEQGDMLGLVGNNGAGKTTLFRLMLDLLQADQGNVTINDIDVAKSEDWKQFTGAFIDDGGVEHAAHGQRAQNGADHHHAGQCDHALGEALAGVLDLVDVGGNFLAAAHSEHQNGQRGEVGDVEVRDEAAEAQVRVHIFGGGVDSRGGKHHHDVQQRHDKGAGAGGGEQLFQRVQAEAGDVAAQQQDAEGGQLDVQGGEGVVGLRVAEDGPAQRLEEAAALAGDVGDVAGPVGPAGVVSKLCVGGLVQPGADAAALVLEGRAQLTHHQGIGDEVKREHQDPAEDDLRAVEVDKAVGDVAKAPHGGKGHERKDRPADLGGFGCFLGRC